MKLTMAKIFTALTVFVLLCMPSVGWSLSLNPRFESSEKFGETFTAAFHGSDGSMFLFQFIFSNAGFGDRKAACRLLSAPAGQKASNHMLRFDDDEWAYRDHSNTLDLGKCTLTTDKSGTTFTMDHGKVSAKLHTAKTLKKHPTPTVKPSDGLYEAEVLLRGAASTVMWSTGSRRGRIVGRTYFDHTRSTASMADLADIVYRVRAMGETSYLYQVVKAKNIKGWLHKTDGLAFPPLTANDVRIAPDDTAPSLTFTRPGFEGRISVKKVLYRYKPVEAFGVMGKLASPIIGNPETVTFLATLTRPDGTTIPALLERTIVDP